jgi:hypothetical protein
MAGAIEREATFGVSDDFALGSKSGCGTLNKREEIVGPESEKVARLEVISGGRVGGQGIHQEERWIGGCSLAKSSHPGRLEGQERPTRKGVNDPLYSTSKTSGHPAVE